VDTGRKGPTGRDTARKPQDDALPSFQTVQVPSAISSFLTLLPDGKHFIACRDGDFNVTLCETEAGKMVRSFPGRGRSKWPLAVSKDGTKIAAYGEDAVFLWDAGTAREIASTKPAPGFRMCGVAITDDRRVLVAVTGSGAAAGLIQVYDVETQKEIARMTGHTGRVRQVLLAPDGERAVSSGDDNTLRVWDIVSKQEIHRLGAPSRSPKSMALSPDGKMLLTTHHEGRVYLWDLETGNQARVFEGNRGEVDAVAFSPDGRWVAAGGWDSILWVWDRQTGDVVCKCKAEGIVTGILLAPQQGLAIAGNFGGKLFWYRLPSGGG
jgi:WD40 repeat protein